MDLKSQELFPSLTSNPAQPAAIWQKRKLPGLEMVAESSIERLDIPKDNLLKKTLGPSISDICKSLMARKKVSVELSSNKRTGMVTLIIHGSPSNVLATKRELLSQLTKVVTMNIPNFVKPFVIGKGGCMLKGITTRSMTKIVIPKKDAEESNSVEIVISGDEQGVEMAKDEIMDIVKKQTSNYRGKTKVQKFLHQFIGLHITCLENDYNVKIHVPPFHDHDDGNINEEIVMFGEMENVISAIDKLNKLVEELALGLGTIAVPLKKAQHRFIFGTKGKGKQEIFEKTGCVVIIPGASDPLETITIRGPEHMLSMALQAVLEKANSVIIGTIDCKSILQLSDAQVLLYLRYLFTREISSIKEIQTQKSVNIYRQSGLPMVLEVQGHSKKELDEGMCALKALISCHAKSLYAQMVNIPYELHSYIIGKGGQNISKLKNLPGINGKLLDILLPPGKEKSDAVGIIISRVSDMNSPEIDAENLICSITKSIIDEAREAANTRTEELLINSRFHGRLIGAGGSMMKELLGPFENCVKLSFFSSKALRDLKKESDPLNDKILVRGNMDGVQQICQKILRMVDQWEKVESLTSFSRRINITEEVMRQLFSGFESSDGDLDQASFTWLIRDIRKKIAEIPSLQEELKKDPFNIYSHRSFHLRLVIEPSGLLLFGPQIIVPIAVDIINAMAETLSKTTVMEFSLFDSESLSDGIILGTDIYDRVLGRLIGKDGRNIKKLGEKYNVNVKFSKPKDADGAFSEDEVSTLGMVSLKGFIDDVKSTRKELVELFAKEIKNSYRLIFSIPKASVGLLLGLKDFNSQKLKSTHSVFMKISDTEENTNVILEGDEINCEAVKDLILAKVNEMVNNVSFELRIPHYLHRHLIGPKGENISSIISTFNDHGKISIDISRKSFSPIGSDIVTVNCHKHVSHLVKAKIDDFLRLFLFPVGEGMVISQLFSNGLESYITLSLKDFKRIGGNNGDKFIALTRKYEACVFIENGSQSSVTLRLVGKTKTASESLKQFLSEEKESTAYLDIPDVIHQNFENQCSEVYFFKSVISKLKKEFNAEFDISSTLMKSGKVLVSCSARNLSPLEMFFNSKMQKLGDHFFLSHIHIPKDSIARIIGKGGETLKKIRQASAAWVDIYPDHESGQEIAIISGPSLESVDVTKLQIGRHLKNFSTAVKNDMIVESSNNTLARPQFPPGYGDNFSKTNLRFSNSQDSLSQMMGDVKSEPRTHSVLKFDAFNPEDDCSSHSLDSSQTSTLCDSFHWQTIKGGKAVKEEQLTKTAKKKKKKKQKNGNDSALVEQVLV